MTSPASGWLRAGAVSFGAHALLVLAIAVGAWWGRGRATPAPPPTGELAFPAVIDLSVVEEILPVEPIPPPEPPVAPATSDAPATASQAPVIPSPGPQQHLAAASDRGAGAGRPTEDVAWRRDRSTLHDHLANGADRYQPAHSRVATAAASPQADRREPTTGIGDAPRSARTAGGPAAESLGLPDPDTSLRGGDTATPGAIGAAPTLSQVAPGQPTRAPRNGEGPLDTSAGTRAFDVERRGRAADDRSVRAASAELHPSVTDLSAPAAPGTSNEGHGVAALPGASARPVVRPAAASAAGYLGPITGNGAGSARERAHARYESEIRARVKQALVFPRALAVRLLLGETMLAFSVSPDGHVDGPIAVTKSAGYEEFDRAAVDAVRHASPFPPLPSEVAQDTKQGRSFSLRVTFSNPVIR